MFSPYWEASSKDSNIEDFGDKGIIFSRILLSVLSSTVVEFLPEQMMCSTVSAGSGAHILGSGGDSFETSNEKVGHLRLFEVMLFLMVMSVFWMLEHLGDGNNFKTCESRREKEKNKNNILFLNFTMSLRI